MPHFDCDGDLVFSVYHINCYNVVVNAERNEDVANWNTMGIREYFQVYEECTETALDLHDQLLVTNLCSGNSAFCAFCWRSISTAHQAHRTELATPFWVLVDIVSCWIFLCFYPIGVVLLFILGTLQSVWSRTDYRRQADSHKTNYGVMEQDLSYFDGLPHSTSNVIRDKMYDGSKAAISVQ